MDVNKNIKLIQDSSSMIMQVLNEYNLNRALLTIINYNLNQIEDSAMEAITKIHCEYMKEKRKHKRFTIVLFGKKLIDK